MLPILMVAALVLPPPQTADPNGDSQGAVSRFMRDHGWRLLFCAGVDKAADVYGHQIGESREPLLFRGVPGIDRAVHDTFTTGAEGHDYFAVHGLETFRYGTPLVLLGLDFGSWHELSGDLFGAADAFFLNRGLTGLTKAVIGRRRPTLEFADRKALGPAAFAALQAAPDERRSFPSGHSSGSFTWASYLDRVVARKYGPRSLSRKIAFAGLYGAAAYIGYTRIREGEHYLTDVVAGSALGIGLSRWAYRSEHSPRSQAPRVRLLTPQILQGGAALTIGIRLSSDPP
ncbi:MAG: phosphatase PAP2 family protein [Acidobacteria bacterium]|nr:phosphatase PAP2 family protein [Acidobacteriota bacterium]